MTVSLDPFSNKKIQEIEDSFDNRKAELINSAFLLSKESSIS